MKIASSIVMESTPRVVFGWLDNPEKASVWMTSVSGWEILHEAPEKVGTTFREVVEGENGFIEMRGFISGFEQDKSISFHLESRVNIVDVKYYIENIDEGVRLVYHAKITWKFPVSIISVLMGNKMRQNIIAQVQAELSTLRGLCE